MTALYALRKHPTHASTFSITKFDGDMNPESTYVLTKENCSCPQAHKPTCRHRKMLSMFFTHHHINDGWFLDWDTRLWRKPIHELEAEDNTLADSTSIGKAEAKDGEELYGLYLEQIEATREIVSSSPSPQDPPAPARSVEQPSPLHSASASSAGGSTLKRRRMS